MFIEPGQDLLHYRIVEKIGEGGMGVVWKAVDTNLDRAVAIKVLSEPWSGEIERLNRFEREAKLLASLNHPNIASVYGLHEVDGARFIVMELVEGEDLDRRLARGALPVDEALGAARRIARDLEAAHEHGVIHRDLKPANTVLTPDANVKVLDFGLAKAQDTHASSTSGPTSPSLSPTLTSAGTVAGMILGTAAYLSPEQARGKPVDRRTDIWAFGCTLYEMLTGRRAFPGETLTDILAAVVHKEPDWSALPPETPHTVWRLLERCLRKDPDRRLRDAGDARVEMEDALDGDDRVSEPAAPTRGAWWKRTLGWAAAVLLGAALIVSLVGGPEPEPQTEPLRRDQRPGTSRASSRSHPVTSAIGVSSLTDTPTGLFTSTRFPSGDTASDDPAESWKSVSSNTVGVPGFRSSPVPTGTRRSCPQS